MVEFKRSGVGFVLGALVGLSFPRPAAAAELWVPPTHFTAPLMNTFPWPVTGAGYGSFSFSVPHDFEALHSVTLSLIPKGDVSGTFDVYRSIRRSGETAGTELLYELAIPATLTAETLQEIDLTSLLANDLDASSAGVDHVSIFFWFPASPGLEDAHVLGLRLTYEPTPLGSAELAEGSVTNAKLADDSVGPGKVVDNSLTGLDVANGSLRREDVDQDEVQLRVTGSCPEGQGIREISATGEVRCQSIGLASHLIETAEVVCSGLGFCHAVVSCPSGLTVTGGGHSVQPGQILFVVNSYPGDHEWNADAYVNGGPPVTLRVYAICSAKGEAIGASAPRRELPPRSAAAR